jgi:antitoxin ChpS
MMKVNMLNAALRRSGGSLIVTIPQSYIEQNHLDAGSRLQMQIAGAELTLRVSRQRPKLADLLKATPRGAHRVAGWDDLGAAGAEL